MISHGFLIFMYNTLRLQIFTFYFQNMMILMPMRVAYSEREKGEGGGNTPPPKHVIFFLYHE